MQGSEKQRNGGHHKRSQHFKVTYGNIVGCNMLRPLGQPAATCCDMFGAVGLNLSKQHPTRCIKAAKRPQKLR